MRGFHVSPQVSDPTTQLELVFTWTTNSRLSSQDDLPLAIASADIWNLIKKQKNNHRSQSFCIGGFHAPLQVSDPTEILT